MILIDLEVEVVVPSSEEYRDPELTTNESFFELLICADMSGSRPRRNERRNERRNDFVG